MRAAPKEEPPPPDLTEPLLSLLDPTSLLSQLGPGIPLSGVAGAGAAALWAYAPTAAYWAQLTEALVRATRREGELSLGGNAEPPEGGQSFELLLSDDGGRSFHTGSAADSLGVLAARGITPYPAAVAAAPTQGLFLLSGRDPQGQPWRALLREQPAAATK